jgi:hypothetical protein
VVEAVELLVARLDLQRRFLPLAQLAARASAPRLSDTVSWRVIEGLPVADRIKQARVPRFAGLELEFETDPSVGIDRLGITLVRRDCDPALEVLVDISDR